jgi:hypothetical protein
MFICLFLYCNLQEPYGNHDPMLIRDLVITIKGIL